MAYGSSGTSGWDKSGGGNSNDDRHGLNNRYQGGYQSSHSNNYKPPAVSGNYAQQQTHVMEDTMRTHYETEGTAATVLTQMQTQRQQLQGANQNVWEMRQATEKAKKDITSMVRRTRRKKLKLQMIAAALAAIDLFLFLRLVQCGGRFFCRSNSSSSSSGQYNDNSSSNSYYDGNY